jgi:hypothetical protein
MSHLQGLFIFTEILLGLACSICFQASISQAMPLTEVPTSIDLDHLEGFMVQSRSKLIARSLITARAGSTAIDGDFQGSVHLDIALAGTVLLLCLQYYIRLHGYKLSRSFWYSTDDIMWTGMGSVSLIWTIVVLLSAFIWPDHDVTDDYDPLPCKTNPHGSACAGRLAFAPWILDLVFCWWLCQYICHRFLQYLRRKSTVL